MAMILVIDNYDSFTYNLVQYLGELGADIKVMRNDAVTLEEVAAAIASTETESLRTTFTSAPSSPRYCTRLYVNES